MQAPGEAVDVVVGPERLVDRLDVLLVQLLRVVELVPVDQVAEPLDRAENAPRRVLARPLRLVAAGTKRVTIVLSAQMPRLVFTPTTLQRTTAQLGFD